MEGSLERAAFMTFLDEIRDDLNPEIGEADAIEMLAQHLITKPVFDTLFKDNDFTTSNPVSKAMETVLGQLDQHNIGKELESLQSFYESVQRRAEGIRTAQGRQALVVQLYDKFFRTAFPAMTQKLGIVYTPVEVVDFIIHSVNDVLKSEFGQTLGSRGVHILDPFTGTGTFIARLLQSGLITPEELEHKYKNEIHANEIVLLAYYIAAINIEAVYHDIAGPEVPYSSFNGIVLTDTFQLYEQERDMVADLLPDNSERRTRQKDLDIRVIIGNPPYSTGQKSENDNAKNIEYPALDRSIRDTYAAASKAALKQALYDSYIRAIRWASERIGDAGAMAYVTNAGWVDGNATDGLRKCLVEEFSDVYIFHLRGNQRTSGELSRKEGGKIFGSGSRAPIAISVFVKNPRAANATGNIHFHDIGDYLDQKQKLDIIQSFGSIDGITRADGWESISPDQNNDWLDQIDKSFEKFPLIGDKKAKSRQTLFDNYSSGVKTQRDSWCINSSRRELMRNVDKTVKFFNMQVERFHGQTRKVDINGFIDNDPRKISWTGALKNDLVRQKKIDVNDGWVTTTLYRPFSKQSLYFSRRLNERVSQIPSIFPSVNTPNLVIQVSGVGARSGFSSLMSNTLPSYDLIEKGQCFPLYLYKKSQPVTDLFAAPDDLRNGFSRHDAISEEGLAYFLTGLPGQKISKEDLFYYIYGLLHSPDYRKRFRNNLAKALPRIPAVRSFDDFADFRNAGRALGDLHVNFESVAPYMVSFEEGDHDLIIEARSDPKAFYRVEKMKFGGTGKDKDKTTVLYNPRITMTNIPLRAYDYMVNGRSALDWIIERQCVKTDKASGIINDANDYANESVGDSRYPMELFQRVITVSLKTLDIIDKLPKLDID